MPSRPGWRERSAPGIRLTADRQAAEGAQRLLVRGREGERRPGGHDDRIADARFLVAVADPRRRAPREHDETSSRVS